MKLPFSVVENYRIYVGAGFRVPHTVPHRTGSSLNSSSTNERVRGIEKDERKFTRLCVWVQVVVAVCFGVCGKKKKL